MFIERQTREIDPNGSGQDEAVHSEQPGIDIVLHASITSWVDLNVPTTFERGGYFEH